ncbi:glutamate 5-kinase [Hwanghaeella sp.]|uniref:glutamate 5-kinase n=1 Tax=Hwanghaeella sp. TaxID=2605943 RepID=UPI003CCC1224
MGNVFKGAKRVVIKIGSALLVDQSAGTVRRDWLAALSKDVAMLRARGAQVLIVSSGSIAAGRRHLGLQNRGLKLEEKQAAAATGQITLAHAYQESLAAEGFTAAQILLTPGDTEERRRHLNARATILQLLSLGAVPVINENDTVATAEIRYGDNDRLAARVATMVSADTLVLLSDIDGLYTADPRKDETAKHLPVVDRLTPEILAMAGNVAVSAERGGFSTGGMVTKLEAAKIALGGGCRMIIARGNDPHPLQALVDGARCTVFTAPEKPVAARKRWIAGQLNASGTLVVDKGAAEALANGKSLLPAGVVRVDGAFERGDPVNVAGPDGNRLAVGLTAYSSTDAEKIVGRQSKEIADILGFEGRSALIHRDDLALLSDTGKTGRSTEKDLSQPVA